jgi:THO complex subunit 4
VSFNKPTAAADAVKLDGTLVDGKPLRIELLIGANALPATAPKSLQDRVS